MYRNNKNNFSVLLLLTILLFVSHNKASAAEPFSLSPIKPPIFNRGVRLLEKIQRSHLLQQIDALCRFARLYELAAAACSPEILIIPPVGDAGKIPAATSRIKVLSANLLLFPTPFFFNQEQRIDEFAKCVRELNPDIIFMQEVWDNTSLSLLIAALPDYYSIHSPGIGYNYSGLLTLSRFAPKRARIRRFSTSIRHSLEEFIAQKSILSVELAAGQHPLHLLNTHLYSAPPGRNYRPNVDQFKLLADIAKSVQGKTIVGGDMNLRPEELESLLPANLLRDNCHLPTAGYPHLSQKLDYIIAGSTSGLASVDGRRIDTPLRFSDHNPVFSEVSFHD